VDAQTRLIVLDPIDSVAVTTRPLKPGEVAVTEAGDEYEVTGRVPAGHKVALRDHARGEAVIKYGAPIGVACVDIRRGEHVHSHNLVTVRGRRASVREAPSGR